MLPKTKLISKACSILENRASVQSDPKAVKSKNRTLELMETTLMNSVAEVDENLDSDDETLINGEEEKFQVKHNWRCKLFSVTSTLELKHKSAQTSLSVARLILRPQYLVNYRLSRLSSLGTKMV